MWQVAGVMKAQEQHRSMRKQQLQV